MTTKILSKLCSPIVDAQRSEVGYDGRATAGSPSGNNYSTVLKLVSILVLVLTIGVGNALGAADYTYTLASGDFTTSSHSKTSGGITWTHSHTSGTESYGWDSDWGFKFGSSNSSYPSAFKLTSSSVSNKIKKVVVTANVNSKKSCKLDVKVASTTYGSQATINTKNNDTWEFSIADASAVNGVIELSFSSNTGPLYLVQIEVYYLAASCGSVPTVTAGSLKGSFFLDLFFPRLTANCTLLAGYLGVLSDLCRIPHNLYILCIYPVILKYVTLPFCQTLKKNCMAKLAILAIPRLFNLFIPIRQSSFCNLFQVPYSSTIFFESIG